MQQQLILSCLLTLSLTACGGVDSQKLQQLKQQSLEDFIFVKGGTFTMGDFGAIINGQRRYYTLFGIKGKEPHQVTLTSYSLTKNKVTWGEYDTFLVATGRKVQGIDINFKAQADELPFFWGENRQPHSNNKTLIHNDDEWPNYYYYKKPASVQWQNAKDYCQWLGQELNFPIDLVTEAQWEYAARSGGQEVLFSNGEVDYSKANPGFFYLEDVPKVVKKFTLAGFTKLEPVGSVSTPNQLGFVEMDSNGTEWVNDWYGESYYRDNPKITDPKGPDSGDKKVVRIFTYTFDRVGYRLNSFLTFRCAVNSDKPIKK